LHVTELSQLILGFDENPEAAKLDAKPAQLPELELSHTTSTVFPPVNPVGL